MRPYHHDLTTLSSSLFYMHVRKAGPALPPPFYALALCSNFLSSTIGANIMGSHRTPPNGPGIHRLPSLLLQSLHEDNYIPPRWRCRYPYSYFWPV